ncbi:hypothetical protein HA402_004953 [Bradysia odoriphaga]|nr:hypothetical protein HA402_004953 [Bradysia odoriphaga]
MTVEELDGKRELKKNENKTETENTRYKAERVDRSTCIIIQRCLFSPIAAASPTFAFWSISNHLNQGKSYDSKIRFYTGPTVADYVSYDLEIAQNVADHSQFNVSRTNMIYIHGWRQSAESKTTQVLLTAYLTNGTFNIFALDWCEAAANDRYDVVVQKVEPLARAVALFIDRWNLQKGIQFSKIHLVGHSVGALMAGSVGKYTRGWSGQTKIIDRITGLDPAIIGNDFLHGRYARFVDIIHTDANGFGNRRNTGHVDFWPNNGVAVQPGCPSSMASRSNVITDIDSWRIIRVIDIHILLTGGCSHNRSVLLYAESVQRANRTGNFLSTNDANSSIVIEMGLNCPTTKLVFVKF